MEAATTTQVIGDIIGNTNAGNTNMDAVSVKDVLAI
jgi:hypothetical protein